MYLSPGTVPWHLLPVFVVVSIHIARHAVIVHIVLRCWVESLHIIARMISASQRRRRAGHRPLPLGLHPHGVTLIDGIRLIGMVWPRWRTVIPRLRMPPIGFDTNINEYQNSHHEHRYLTTIRPAYFHSISVLSFR